MVWGTPLAGVIWIRPRRAGKRLFERQADRVVVVLAVGAQAAAPRRSAPHAAQDLIEQAAEHVVIDGAIAADQLKAGAAADSR